MFTYQSTAGNISFKTGPKYQTLRIHHTKTWYSKKKLLQCLLKKYLAIKKKINNKISRLNFYSDLYMYNQKKTTVIPWILQVENQIYTILILTCQWKWLEKLRTQIFYSFQKI